MRGRRPYGHESNPSGTLKGIDLRPHREAGWSLPEAAYGRVFCGRFAPPNYQALRIERMRAALAKRLRNLKSWKDIEALFRAHVGEP